MDTCSECGFDGRRMSPGDAEVAARSFPRRFRSLIVRRDDEENAEALVRRRPPDGDRSALELVADAAAALEARADDVRRVLITDQPDVCRPVPAAEPSSVDGTLDRLDAAAERFADAVSRGGPSDWTRPARAPSGPVTTLDVVADGIHEAVHRLRRIDGVMRAVRGRSA